MCVCARPCPHKEKKRVLPKRNPKEPKNQKNKEQKNRKNAEKGKSPRVGLNPSYRIPTKRRRAIPSDHSDMAVLL